MCRLLSNDACSGASARSSHSFGGCAGPRAFVPATHAVVPAPDGGIAAADYDLDVEQHRLGQARVWPLGAYRDDSSGETRTIVHVGFGFGCTTRVKRRGHCWPEKSGRSRGPVAGAVIDGGVDGLCLPAEDRHRGTSKA